MKKEDVVIYQGIQRNTDMAMQALDTVSDKVYDKELSMQIARESVKYSELYNRAKNKLLQGKAETYVGNHINHAMLKGAIHCNTLLNTATSHMAEMLIQGSNRGIVDMCRILNKYPHAAGQSVELAKELMDFEEKNVERLKKYL